MTEKNDNAEVMEQLGTVAAIVDRLVTEVAGANVQLEKVDTVAVVVDTLVKEVAASTIKLGKVDNVVTELEHNFQGNPALGIPPIFDRVFNAIKELPCGEHEHQIRRVEEKVSRLNGYRRGKQDAEVNKAKQAAKKYGIPTGIIGAVGLLIWEIIRLWQASGGG